MVEIDFRSYFTTIPHDKLMTLIKQRVVDGSMLRLIKQSLTVGIAYRGEGGADDGGSSARSHRSRRSTATSTSTCWIRCGTGEATRRNWGPRCIAMPTMRILVCRQNATQALQAFEAIAQRMGLTINREKTRITKLTEGFDFIGFQFVKRRSPNSGKLSIYIFPSKSAQRNIRRRIK